MVTSDVKENKCFLLSADFSIGLALFEYFNATVLLLDAVLLFLELLLLLHQVLLLMHLLLSLQIGA